jgi:hypothetical protein
LRNPKIPTEAQGTQIVLFKDWGVQKADVFFRNPKIPRETQRTLIVLIKINRTNLIVSLWELREKRSAFGANEMSLGSKNPERKSENYLKKHNISPIHLVAS